MKKTLLLFTIVAACSCNNDKKEKAGSVPDTAVKIFVDSLLVTDSAWGAITTATDFAGLQTIFGAANVKDERICGPECIDSIDVTKVYPETNREIIIYWKDSLYHRSIGMLKNYDETGPYRTATGLKIGSTLTDLLKLNGKKISFYGFGWDYGGTITSYNNGTMEKTPIHFDLDIDYEESAKHNNLMGDIELNSDMPAVQQAAGKIRIRSITLSFHKD